MQCPVCPSSTLVMTERSGIEIDYCPACRGVWLDRGELDKIIDRAGASTPAADSPVRSGMPIPADDTPPRSERSWRRDDSDEYPRPRDGDRYGHPRKKKRSSIFEELFDF